MTIGHLMGLAVLSFLLDGFALWIRSIRFAGEARSHVQIGAAYVFTTTVVLGNLWLILLGTAAPQTGSPSVATWGLLAMLLVVTAALLWLLAELAQTLRAAQSR
jgi:hypothetical protein